MDKNITKIANSVVRRQARSIEKMIFVIIGTGILVYIILLISSFSYSCAGWDRSCGLCWVGIVQMPLDFISWVKDKIVRRQK